MDLDEILEQICGRSRWVHGLDLPGRFPDRRHVLHRYVRVGIWKSFYELYKRRKNLLRRQMERLRQQTRKRSVFAGAGEASEKSYEYHANGIGGTCNDVLFQKAAADSEGADAQFERRSATRDCVVVAHRVC